VVEEAAGEPGAADAAGEEGDAHGAILAPAGPRHTGAACALRRRVTDVDHDRTATAREIERALGRAARGVALDVDEASALMQAEGEHLERLLDLAGAVRDRGLENAGRPGVVTYSRKVFIPLTRLCRDRCHYCTFATDPASLRREGHGMFLSPDEVLEIARAGAALGCKEALFTLGDRPEERWPAAREWLDAHGYDDTLSYVRAMAVRVLEETGLLPHLNPGVMTWEELGRLKPVAPSMGMMLETSATRLWSEPGGPHFGSPDKEPALRLRVIEDAGRQAVPFTTGILVGIGETYLERAQSVLDLRRVAREHGHVQEVIVQNFRAKPDTALRHRDDLGLTEYLAAIATARLLLGPRMRIQAPPNLTDAAEFALLLRAGVDDWGGVSPLTPDHVNPERPWPHLDELARLTAEAGFVLRERLTVHPEYVQRPDPWIDPRIRPHVRALADADGLGVKALCPKGSRGRTPTSPTPASPPRTPAGAPTSTTPSTPRAAAATGAATSTRCTATGRRSTSTPATSPGATPRPGSPRSSASTPTSAPGSRSPPTTPRPSRTPATPPSPSPSCRATAPAWTRSRGSRTTCAATPSATTSPTS